MTETSATVIQFLDHYERLKDRLNKALREYLGDPGRTQTKSLRAAVRRLDAAIRVLPKGAQKEKAMRRCHERCREVLRETSRIRDVDLLSERIARHKEDSTVAFMLKNLGEEREEFVDRTRKAAWKLFEHHPPKLARRDLPRFARRAEGALDELKAEIALESRVALKDEAKVDELHSLRKHCKRLRYTLELFPSVRNQSRLVSDLRVWQDALGEIRDCDVVVEYLSRARPTEAVRKALTSERAYRHRKYLLFVRSSKRSRVGRPLHLAGSDGEGARGSRSLSRASSRDILA